MNALEILNNFIEEGNPPDELSLEWPDGENAEIRFGWDCGTVLTLPNVNGIYISVWARFQEFWHWPYIFLSGPGSRSSGSGRKIKNNYLQRRGDGNKSCKNRD